jgi:hypothetical protein
MYDVLSASASLKKERSLQTQVFFVFISFSFFNNKSSQKHRSDVFIFFVFFFGVSFVLLPSFVCVYKNTFALFFQMKKELRSSKLFSL